MFSTRLSRLWKPLVSMGVGSSWKKGWGGGGGGGGGGGQNKQQARLQPPNPRRSLNATLNAQNCHAGASQVMWSTPPHVAP